MRNHGIKEKRLTETYISPFTRKIIPIDYLNSLVSSNVNHGLCGSQNMGNTCYMNSSIACLSNCLELTYYFLSEEFRKNINKKNKDGLGGELAENWYKLLKEYWTTSANIGNPYSIKELISKKNKKFAGDEQQDSNEFMTVFLELLGEDLNAATTKLYRELGEQKDNEDDIDCAKRFWELHLERNNSIITDLFHGLFKSTIICPCCKWKNITYDPFNTLALTIPTIDNIKMMRNNKNKIRFQNLINNNGKVRKKRKKKIQHFSLYYVPQFSISQTKKFEIDIFSGQTLIEIAKEIQKRQKEVKIFFPLLFTVIANKEFQGYINPDTPKPNENYIFSYQYESRDNVKYTIPIYLSIDDKKSSYPRFLFFHLKTTFYEFEKKIYILARKYFNSPFSSNNEDKKNNMDIELEKYIGGQSNNFTKILQLLEEEYDYINNNENDIEKIKYFFNNFPYKIILQRNFKENSENNAKNNLENNSFLISNGIKRNEIFLNDFNIKDYQSYVDTLLNVIEDNHLYLMIKFNSKSPFLIKDIRFDMCSVTACEEIENINENINNDIEMKIEYPNNNNYDENNTEDNEEKYSGFNITLDHCLQYFTEEESLEEGNEWQCQRCNKKVKASKKIEIFYLPRIMCICLTRFNRKGKKYTKNDELVEFPLENLDMGKYICGPDKDFSKYDLFAISQHFGGMGSGHYTAVCKNVDGFWYNYDDVNIRRINNLNKICTNAAYVLFFRRQNW